jgi:tRNA A-37 threonylcarbamoyl transferase component Bud32
MTDHLVDQFLAGFDDSRYPQELLQKYELMECLSHNEQAETYLVKERQTGKFQVAKCYTDKSCLSHTSESDLLQNIHNRRFPEFITEIRSDGMVCVLREFVQGVTLDQYLSTHQVTVQSALSICIQLCEDLTYLHSQNPAIIHRDIKPQNIIMDAAGVPHLIDFGNSRFYDEHVTTDTVAFGTRYFAAPEQYGFAQTDARTDIFALGILLAWLLTGEMDIKSALVKVKDRQLKAVIQKCTQFDPKGRYQTAARLKADLLAVLQQTTKTIFRWVARVAVCAAFLVLGFSVGRFTDFSPALFAPGTLHFKEPLVEQAVRLSLGKAAGDPITEAELSQVTELYIFGNHAFTSREEFEAANQLMAHNDPSLKNGGMTSLNDLIRLKNLKAVYIAYQNISDISPLQKLENLEQVELKHNPITEVSPLAGKPRLREVFLFDTRVADLTPLADCPELTKVDIGRTSITSPADLAGITGLTSLFAFNTNFTTLHGIESFDHLEEIALSGVADGDLTPLLSLPKLRVVRLNESLRTVAEKDLAQAGFDITYQ